MADDAIERRAAEAGRRPAEREDAAGRRRGGLRRLRRRCARPRHRRAGRRRRGHDLPPLPDPGRPHRRRLPAPGRSLRRGRSGAAGGAAAHRTPPWRVDRALRRLPGHQARSRRGAAVRRRRLQTLHAYFLDRLVPVCAKLLAAAATAGEIRSDMDAYELMRGVGNLCIGAEQQRPLRRPPHGRPPHRRTAHQLERLIAAPVDRGLPPRRRGVFTEYTWGVCSPIVASPDALPNNSSSAKHSTTPSPAPRKRSSSTAKPASAKPAWPGKSAEPQS